MINRKILSQETVDTICSLYKSGVFSGTIGNKLNISRALVERVLFQNNIAPKTITTQYLALKNKIIKNKEQLTNKTENQISKFLNCNRGALLKRILKECELEKIKIPDEEIAKMYQSGLGYDKIEELTKTSSHALNKIISKFNLKRKTRTDYVKYKIDNNFFKKIDSHEKAAIFGFICADGYNNIKNNYVRINLHPKDVDYLKKINILIQPQKPNPIKYQTTKTSNITYLTIYCKEICNDLNNLGCGQAKSLTLKFPQIPNEFLNSFMLGIFEGDGCLCSNIRQNEYSRAYAVGVCVSNDFGKEAVKKIKQATGLQPRLYKKQKISTMAIGGNLQVQKFMDWIYKDSKIVLNRKFKLYQEMKRYFSQRKPFFKNTKYIYVPVSNEKPLGYYYQDPRLEII